MLVLTRKSGQKLIINDDIEIIILETKGDAVKIGIKAPKNVKIFREEVYEEIKKSNEQASKNAHISDFNSVANLLGTHKLNNNEDFLNKFKSTITIPSKDINKSNKNTDK